MQDVCEEVLGRKTSDAQVGPDSIEESVEAVYDDPDARELYERIGIAGRIGYGAHPAIVVVDLTYGFTDPTAPLGADLDGVVAATRTLLDLARERSVPVVFTAIAYMDSLADAGVWALKSRALGHLKSGTRAVAIDERLGATSDEVVIVKKGASAFFGTPLAAMLTAWGVDTAIITGAATSGCVRATVVDALQYGFRPIVPLECVGDRAAGPHRANLFDIDSKYADVRSLDEVIAYLSATGQRNFTGS